MKNEKHKAQIYYVNNYVMWTFRSKIAFGLQIIHQNLFKMHLDPNFGIWMFVSINKY